MLRFPVVGVHGNFRWGVGRQFHHGYEHYWRMMLIIQGLKEMVHGTIQRTMTSLWWDSMIVSTCRKPCYQCLLYWQLGLEEGIMLTWGAIS